MANKKPLLRGSGRIQTTPGYSPSHLSGTTFRDPCRNWHLSMVYAMVVAGLHRASPSATLDKSWNYVFAVFCWRKYITG
jgi:hypothetical protein